jgi:hypothetical protein
VGFSALYILYVTGLYLLNGDSQFKKLHITFIEVVSSYLVGGIIGGAVVGLLLPLTRRRSGAILVGIVAGICVCMCFGFIDKGWPTQWPPETWFAWLTTGILLGGFGGNILWGTL